MSGEIREQPGAEARDDDRMQLGVEGLDEILGGGLPPNRLYLLQGDPGTGKTTLSLQFLFAGAANGERGLYVTLSETRTELEGIARSHGWSLDGIEIFEIQPNEDHLHGEEQYTAFHPSEVELGETVQTLLDEVERVQPKRVVIDSLSEMRLLARDPLRYRRQILALKQYLVTRGATVLMLDDPANRVGEHQFQTLAHGVILLERHAPEYGLASRRLQILKLRGVGFADGYHDLQIARGGIVVSPRLVAAEHGQPFEPDQLSSGVSEVDELLAGGPERGTSVLVMGPAGCGKSSLTLQYCAAAASRGERAAFFTFDERLVTVQTRCEGLGIPLRHCVESGLIEVQQIDPASLSPGAFIGRVRESVERHNARVVVIDTLNGYLNAMPGERHLILQMHELLTYLSHHGVLTFVVVAQHGLVGQHGEAPVDASYLSDTVILLRYFEHAGQVRKAISVVKKRSGRHEESVRELQIASGSGVRVGPPLKQFHGILSGAPQYTGTSKPLLEEWS